MFPLMFPRTHLSRHKPDTRPLHRQPLSYCHKPGARPLHSPSPAATRRSDAVPLFLQAARPPQAAGLP